MREQMLDDYVHRTQGLPPITMQRVTDDGDVVDWFQIGPEVSRDLLLYEQGLGHQVQIIAGEIQKWHRLSALAKRVWEVRERQYRIWREKFYLDQITPPDDDGPWKKPTEKAIDARARTQPEYADHQNKIEAAEEAYNAVQGVVEGFRAKRDMLKTYVFRHRDAAEPQLSV